VTHGNSNGQSIIKKKKEPEYEAEAFHAYCCWINNDFIAANWKNFGQLQI